jgi:hypothetical protein
MNSFFKKNIFSFFFLFIPCFIYCEGFLAGTLVRIPTGYYKIEELKPGDLIVGYDFTSNKITGSKILAIYKERIDKYIQLSCNNNKIIGVSPTQKFYLFNLKKWAKLQDILNNPRLLYAFQENYNIKFLVEIELEVDIYKFSIENINNFFVTDNNILVHNFIPIIGLSIAFGEGVTVMASTAIGSAILGSLILHNKKYNLPGQGDDWVKLRGDQGWRDAKGNRWKKDKLHKDHWDISDDKGNKIKEVDFEGNEIWPNGPKNKNKRQ